MVGWWPWWSLPGVGVGGVVLLCVVVVGVVCGFVVWVGCGVVGDFL
ncbi:putative membrane protein [Nocardiopsis alba ATCC BAA-2165]|uniref:Putative membrane protein n=1 Tax=Nocardiopsis alba (strain ATCC BAA-2165 / BE74) TaxID=1205910 RepID=J7L5X6_NOCAA|nr:putative membrane protein [Nocardiopsis alba ATCC BAA-2165]